MPDFIPPSYDAIFRHIFADPSDLNPLKSLLGATLDIPQEDLDGLVLLDREQGPEQAGSKTTLLDIHARTATGYNIDIEMQQLPQAGFSVLVQIWLHSRGVRRLAWQGGGATRARRPLERRQRSPGRSYGVPNAQPNMSRGTASTRLP